jgi:hypothetical protein
MASRSYRGGEWATAARLLLRMAREDPLGTLANALHIARKRWDGINGTAGAELLGTRFPAA